VSIRVRGLHLVSSVSFWGEDFLGLRINLHGFAKKNMVASSNYSSNMSQHGMEVFLRFIPRVYGKVMTF
jgi:hypothetical protein